jgi:hypothetical protein
VDPSAATVSSTGPTTEGDEQAIGETQMDIAATSAAGGRGLAYAHLMLSR